MSYDLWGRLRYMLSPQFDIYEQVSKTVHGKVMDIGSGTGFGTHLFTRRCDMVVGVEIDKTARKFAQKTFSNGNLLFFEGDITRKSQEKRDYPASSHYYDFITMIDVIEHITDTKTALKNVKEFLKQGGAFICSTPNRLSRYRKSDYHVREYSPQELKELLNTVFDDVNLVDFELKPMESDYINPIIAVCL